MTLFKNEFSWSISRDDTFRKCQRMYFFHYYGSWGGWSNEIDERTRKIYILKQLQTRKMWAGSKVHECIEKVIKNIHEGNQTINVKKSIDETLNIMRQEFSSSKKRKYLKEPKTCALFEHEYELQLPDIEWKNIANHVVECLNSFFESNIYMIIFKLSNERWLEVEKFSSFQYNDVKVYVVPDFAFRDGDEIVIYDWKTGKEEANDHQLQLSCYGLYAIQQWRIKAENIRTVEFYLSTGKQNENLLTDFELNPIHDYIGNSINVMKDMLDDQHVNIANEDQFEFTMDGQACQYCNFRKVCPR